MLKFAENMVRSKRSFHPTSSALSVAFYFSDSFMNFSDYFFSKFMSSSPTLKTCFYFGTEFAPCESRFYKVTGGKASGLGRSTFHEDKQMIAFI